MCHKYRDDSIARPPTHVFARHARDDPLTPPRLNVMSTMKAWTCAGYGADGNPGDAIAKLEMSEVAIPAPGAGQVQVKISHAAVNPIDWKLFSGGLHGICPCTFPYIPGFDVSGTISAVGEGERCSPPLRDLGGCVFFRDACVTRSAKKAFPIDLRVPRPLAGEHLPALVIPALRPNL